MFMYYKITRDGQPVGLAAGVEMVLGSRFKQ
jgi:hypothetical protein